MYNRTIFQESFKSLLAQRGMTQRDVADALNTTPTTISRYVSGDRTPNLETLVGIAGALGVSIDKLAGVEPPAQPRMPADVSILISCYQQSDDRDRSVLWALLDHYMTPEQRAVITSIQAQEKAEAI